MWAYGKHNIISISFYKFSNELKRIWYYFYPITKKRKDRLKWKISHCRTCITLTFSVSLHYNCITQMTSRQNICTAVQYQFNWVAWATRVLHFRQDYQPFTPVLENPVLHPHVRQVACFIWRHCCAHFISFLGWRLLTVMNEVVSSEPRYRRKQLPSS
jgi:hypothetical protein